MPQRSSLIHSCMLLILCVASASCIDCKLKSLDLKYVRSSPVDLDLDVFFSVSMKLGAEKLPEDVTLARYAAQCIDFIELRVLNSADASLVFNTRQRLVDSQTDLSNIRIRVLDLLPLKTYTIELSLQEKDQTESSQPQRTENVFSCFGAPTKPRDLKLTELTEEARTVSVSWAEPERVNAPRVCFYLVQRLGKEEMSGGDAWVTLKKQADTAAYVLSEEDVKNTKMVRVVAQNHVDCYKMDSPFAQLCPRSEFLAANADAAIVYAATTTSEPITTTSTITTTSDPTTTTTKPNDANLATNGRFLIYSALMVIWLISIHSF